MKQNRTKNTLIAGLTATTLAGVVGMTALVGSQAGLRNDLELHEQALEHMKWAVEYEMQGDRIDSQRELNTAKHLVKDN